MSPASCHLPPATPRLSDWNLSRSNGVKLEMLKASKSSGQDANENDRKRIQLNDDSMLVRRSKISAALRHRVSTSLPCLGLIAWWKYLRSNEYLDTRWKLLATVDKHKANPAKTRGDKNAKCLRAYKYLHSIHVEFNASGSNQSQKLHVPRMLILVSNFQQQQPYDIPQRKLRGYISSTLMQSEIISICVLYVNIGFIWIDDIPLIIEAISCPQKIQSSWIWPRRPWQLPIR